MHNNIAVKPRLFNAILSLSLLLILSSFNAHGFSIKKAELTKTKEYSKSFSVDDNSLVNVTNKFGDVKVTTWDKNEVVINVTVKLEGKREEKLLKVLDNIDVEIQKKGENVFAETIIGKGGKSNNCNCDMEINYTIKMPKTNELEVRNEFGSFYINKLDANLKLKLKFGTSTIGELNGIENDLDFEFCSLINLEKIKGGLIRVQHSKLNIDDANDIELESQFTKVNVDKLTEGKVDVKFGHLKLDEVGSVKAKMKMAPLEISYLKNDIELIQSHSRTNIENIAKNFEQVDVDCEFSPVKLKLESGSSFNVDAFVNMGSFILNGNSIKNKDEMNKVTYKGKVGGSPNSNIKIRSEFGKVKLDH